MLQRQACARRSPTDGTSAVQHGDGTARQSESMGIVVDAGTTACTKCVHASQATPSRGIWIRSFRWSAVADLSCVHLR